MPKSKRQRTRALTQTEKKGSDLKTQVVDAVRNAVDQFETAYVFSFENMRTNHFKKVRLHFRDSRFFLGKNKVMKLALGRTPEEEYADELAKLGNDISGSTGLMFTNKTTTEVQEYFQSLNIPDYARSGFTATDTVTVPAGPLPQFVGSMVESLRKLGLPVDLDKGVITLSREHTICKEGDVLNPEQAKLLVHFGREMATFKLNLISSWTDGKYTSLADEE